MINEGTLQEDGYNEQYAEEVIIRSNLGKGLSEDLEVCSYYEFVGVAQTGSHRVLQIQDKI